MQGVQTLLLLIGIGLVASTFSRQIAYFTLANAGKTKKEDFAFAIGCVSIAQYFILQ